MSLPSSFAMTAGLPLLVDLFDAGIGAGGGVGFGDRRGAEAAGLADLAEADLGALDDGGDVFDAQRGAVLGLEDGLFDVVDVAVRGRLRGR